MKKYKTDIVIIGAGPIGLFTIFQAGMLGMRCHIVDSLEFIGGQCAALYPEKPIYDIPAYKEILARDLIFNLVNQSKPFNPTYHLNQTVNQLDQKGDIFFLKTSLNTEIECKAVIIAAGCGAFGPNKPPIKDIEKYEENSVFYMVKSKEKMRDKTVVIAGGGDSAVDWCLLLSSITKKIYLVHRRDKFKCALSSEKQLRRLAGENKIKILTPYQLDSVNGDNGMIKEVVIRDFEQNKKVIQADILLPFYGLSMKLGPIANWGLNLKRNLIQVESSTMQTSKKGIYAVGDISFYKNKLKLILTGFSESATACYDAYNIIYPDRILHFEYSTSKGIN